MKDWLLIQTQELQPGMLRRVGGEQHALVVSVELDADRNCIVVQELFGPERYTSDFPIGHCVAVAYDDV